MNRIALAVLVVLTATACQAPPPPEPVAAPEPSAPQADAPRVDVTVDASALNVRIEPTLDAEVLTQVKRGTRLALLEAGDSWSKVELPDGRAGWAASRFLLRDGEKPAAKGKRRGNCLPDSDFAFATPPTPAFSDSGAKGDVVVEAHVGANGKVKSTKLVTNTTGDEALAFLTEREIRSATFIAPVRDCAAREFIYTYKRTF